MAYIGLTKQYKALFRAMRNTADVARQLAKANSTASSDGLA